jgi:ribonuclease E
MPESDATNAMPELVVADAVQPELVADTSSLLASPASTTTSTTTSSHNGHAGVAMPLEQLNTMLQQAGLVWASTDPEKLRQAQLAAAALEQAPKPIVKRERKVLPPAPTEPLILVETKR